MECGQSSTMREGGHPTKENIITQTAEFLVLKKKYKNLLEYAFRVESENENYRTRLETLLEYLM